MTERHWTAESDEDFQYAVAYNYTAQLQDAIENDGLSQKDFAKVAGVSESRVSQLFNDPGNMTLKSMVHWARAIGRKVGVVFYDDGDSENLLGPVDPDVFLKCWDLSGRPRDFGELNYCLGSYSDGSKIWASLCETEENLEDGSPTLGIAA